MASKTLFIFEGKHPEEEIAASLTSLLFGSLDATICIYVANVYQLYRKLSKDPDLDVIEVVRERTDVNKAILSPYSRNDFAYVYLFFDYDGHDRQADDNQIVDMLKFFDEETDYGKLFISYPMVEAIRHLPDAKTFLTLTAHCKGSNCPEATACPKSASSADPLPCKKPHYKEISQIGIESRFLHIDKYTPREWTDIIDTNLRKANLMVNGDSEYPSTHIDQGEIFHAQMRDYLTRRPCPQVAVLSAFPLFALDWFGTASLRSKLSL